MDIKSLSIDRIGLSVRASNVLHRAGKHTVGDMLQCTEEQLYGLPSAGIKTVEEILAKISEYNLLAESADIQDTDVDPAADDGVYSLSEQIAVCKELDKRGYSIDDLELLSARAYNLLRISGYRRLSEVIFMSKAELLCLTNMDDENADQIERLCRGWLREHYSKTDVAPLLLQLISLPDNRETVLKYTRAFDKTFEELGLCNRAKNQLRRNGFAMLSDILFLTEAELLSLRAMGGETVNDIICCRQAWLDANEKNLRSLLAGDETVLQPLPPDDGELCNMILGFYYSAPYSGLSLQDFTEKLPEDTPREQIKRCVGKLLAEGELEYVDFRCYRQYPRFYQVAEQCPKLNERNKVILMRRLNGETLEEIGRDYDMTRERVRQITANTMRAVRTWALANLGQKQFYEDYYRYFFSKYSFEKSIATEWLGIPISAFTYLEAATSAKGAKDLFEAPEDLKLDACLRQRIRNYLNRDKLFLDGKWITKRRADLEEYVVERFCRENTGFDEFVELYNSFLKNQDIPFDESLFITEDNARSRKNHLSDARYLLWKYGETIRAYDIDGRDYSELFSSLGLEEYRNIEISTQKFVEEHTDLLAQYDIRDRYELHNLLRKTLHDGDFHDLKIGRTPNICFGSFDRDGAIFELMLNNAPISMKDLAQLVHAEYGYDTSTIIGTYLIPFSDYYHQGEYRIDQKPMTDGHQDQLLAVLDDDFYYFNKLKSIYSSLFFGADLDEINSYNLKKMGFKVYNSYALRGYDNLESYFRNLLTSDELLDISELRRRFTYVQAFSSVLMKLKRDYEVIEFEPNKLVSYRRLSAAGVSRSDLEDFCDAVYEFIEDENYFTAKSLRLSGFDSVLYELGFSDWFYANLLLSDGRFSYTVAFKNIILFKGNKNVTMRSFETALVRAAGSIDVFDFMRELEETYGCIAPDREHILRKVDSSVYYDQHLDRLYANEELFWREVDEAEENLS